MEKNASENFTAYQKHIFGLLQGNILKVDDQNELFELQKPLCNNTVPLGLEKLIKTTQPLTLTQQNDLCQHIKEGLIPYKNKNAQIQAFLEKLMPTLNNQFVQHFKKHSNDLAEMVLEFRKKWQSNIDKGEIIGTGFNPIETECWQDICTELPSFKPAIAANIAIAEYLDTAGNKNYVMRTSLHKNAFPEHGKHAEPRILDFLTAKGIPLTQVTRLYSEIQPCNSQHKCADKLKTDIPQAHISCTFFPYQKEIVSQHKHFIKQKLFLLC